MALQQRKITRDDIMAMDEYRKARRGLRQDVVAVKRKRRLAVGPFVTFYFENYQTMWHQVHEMLYIEKGGEEQIADELRAYNPLIPQGQDLVATVMLEIEDSERRARALAELGGFEDRLFLTVAGETIRGVPEGDIERTREDGKTSSVHFMHFPFTPAQIATFRTPGLRVVVGADHPRYAHMAVMPDEMRGELAGDFAQQGDR